MEGDLAVMYRKFFVYVDDGCNVYRLAIPAKSAKDAEKYVSGNGEIVAVKDVTEDFHIYESDVHIALLGGGFDETKIDFICRALHMIGLVE